MPTSPPQPCGMRNSAKQQKVKRKKEKKSLEYRWVLENKGGEYCRYWFHGASGGVWLPDIWGVSEPIWGVSVPAPFDIGLSFLVESFYQLGQRNPKHCI